MVYNVTFNNILAISLRSVLLVEQTGENHRPAASHWQTLSRKVVSITPGLSGIQLTTLVVIGTDCIGSCKSNYHTITAMTASFWFYVESFIMKTNHLNSFTTIFDIYINKAKNTNKICKYCMESSFH